MKARVAIFFFALFIGAPLRGEPPVGHAPLFEEATVGVEPGVSLISTGDNLPSRSDPAPSLFDEPPSEDDTLSQFIIGGYDTKRNQFILVRSRDSSPYPIELNLDVIMQLRYTGFDRSARSWVDSTGAVKPINNISVFEINRTWFEFSGSAIDPNLQFHTIVFTSTASSDAIFLGYLRYEFDPAFRLNGGYWKVPGTREWGDSFRHTLGVDRTMATTFFRPGFSPGIWIDGNLDPSLKYVAMIANSINGQSETANRIGTFMVYSAGIDWQPWGEFGKGPSAIEDLSDPALRLGSIVTFTRKVNQGVNNTPTNPEDTVLRLSDGTPFFNYQALGPGTQLNAANFMLWTMDAGIKWRGVSLTGEYFLRWLGEFAYSGASPEKSRLFDHGGYIQSGAFFIPQTLEGYVRTSTVAGPYGRGYEWSMGLNWFPRGARNWRLTFDVTRILRSPADNILTGYRAGESGTLFQGQMLVDF